MSTRKIETRRRFVAGLLPVLLTGLLAGHSSAPAATASTPADERPSGDTATSLSFSYKNITGHAFQSRDATDTFRAGKPGCVYLTAAGTERLEHKVLLPDGALVKYLRIYYYDTSTKDLTAWLTEYDGAGHFVDPARVTSVGSTGFDSALSPEMNYVVDHYTKALAIVIDPNTVFDGTLQFCGARIAYYDPTDLETIFRNGFD